MSTGQTSASFFAAARVTRQLRIDLDRDEQRHAHSPPELLAHERGDVLDALGHGDARRRMRSIFSAVVSALPSTIVPAWPKRMPGIASMKRPAMNATTGRRDLLSFTQRARSASMRPPGSE